MNHDILHKWNRHRASTSFHPLAACTEAGIVWGATTCLVPLPDRGDNTIDPGFDRALTLVSVVTGKVHPRLVELVKSAFDQWRSGNRVRANIYLAFARLPRIDDDDAYRLFLADDCIKHGVAPAELLRELEFEASEVALLKYPGQPRVPGGNGKQSGEYGWGTQGAQARVQPVRFVSPLTEDRVDEQEEHLSSSEQKEKYPVPPTPHLLNPVPLLNNGPGGQFSLSPRQAPRPPVPTGKLPQDGFSQGNASQGAKPGGPTIPKLDGNPGALPDLDDPRLRAIPCPPPAPDVKRGSNAAGDRFEIFGHETVNRNNPLKLGEGTPFRGQAYDDCAQTDDPQGRWKAGDMIEFKGGTGHDWLISQPWFTNDWKQAARYAAALRGTNRNLIYLVESEVVAREMTKKFRYYDVIKVYHLPIVDY